MTYMTLAQRIELELGKREPSEIVELNLDNSKASDLEGLTDDFVNLEVLSLANVGLQSLANLPNLPALRTLELSNNLISGGLEALLSCPNIEQLNLSNNKVESFESLAPLVKLSCLRSLDLVNCPVAAVENYRKKAFAMFSDLKYLDGLDENEEEEPVGEGANGDLQEAGDNEDEVDEGDEDEEGSDVDDEDDGEDEIGIEALQRSGDLEDDEEDYAPGEDEEAELDDYDDVDDEDEDEVEEDTGANLSAAGVTGPRRPAAKRRHEDEVENGDEVPCSAKHKAADGVDAHVNNGSNVEK